jgi:acetoacetyl-CoA synthetase
MAVSSGGLVRQTEAMTPNQAPEPLWTPDDCSQAESTIARFQAFACRRHELDLHLDRQDYAGLWRWSVAEPADFWAAVWDFFELGERGPGPVIDAVPMPGTGWFHGTTVNLAEAILAAGEPQDVAVVGVCECGAGDTLTRAALREQVASVAEGLRNLGIGSGDRVVGYLPNTPEAVVAFLAVASVGALWSAVGQDYAPRAVVDRFAQLEPVLLFACDGYHWNGATVDRSADVRTVRELLPTLRHTVLVPHLCEAATGEAEPGTLPWSTLVETDGSAHVAERLPFDHPLWVLFSSGTTGLPKGLVHGHGGILVEAVKQLGLHVDVGPGDRFFWYTSPQLDDVELPGGWRCCVGATILCYDGSPTYPQADALWSIAATIGATVLGTSPGYVLACAKAGAVPRKQHDLSALRSVGITGSSLPPSSALWLRDNVGERVQVNSISGGTDVVSAFIGGVPTVPVWPGELSAPFLGVALDAWDEAGNPVRGEVGELVITKPMPSMPFYLLERCTIRMSVTATPISRCSPACGGTATGSPSPTTAASSCTAARTRR